MDGDLTCVFEGSTSINLLSCFSSGPVFSKAEPDCVVDLLSYFPSRRRNRETRRDARRSPRALCQACLSWWRIRVRRDTLQNGPFLVFLTSRHCLEPCRNPENSVARRSSCG